MNPTIASIIIGLYFVAFIIVACYVAITLEADAISQGHTKRWDDPKP